MLGLQNRTNADWIESANRDPATLLSDHAHCEKKAATMAISLLNRYPEKMELVKEMAELAQEEMRHFALVIQKLEARGLALHRDAGDYYAQALHETIRKQEPARLLDTLIVSSLIEARSCERFLLLAETSGDTDLKMFYRSLLESEARHRNQFLSLAKLYFSPAEVKERLAVLEREEAKIVDSLKSVSTMHG